MAIPSKNILELCAGYGGIGLGLGLVEPNARTICYVEREITAAGILAARFADGTLEPAPVWSDLRTFDGRAWRGIVDTLVAGYPCQPFSVAGKRRGKNDLRHLWPEVARIIRESEPAEVFLENVGGHLRLGFREVAQELRAMGYRVAAGLFTAEEVGAPHRRERLFALAHFDGGRRAKFGAAHDDDGNHARRHDARRRDEELEDAARLDGERGWRRRVPQASDALANSGNGFVSQSRRRAQARTGFGSAVATLADAASARSQIDGYGQHRETEFAASARGGFLFPPGPEDFDAWRDVLRKYPEIEPAVCGKPYGVASRVDRLRSLGNGVVPLVAARAYSALRAHFDGSSGSGIDEKTWQ